MNQDHIKPTEIFCNSDGSCSQGKSGENQRIGKSGNLKVLGCKS